MAAGVSVKLPLSIGDFGYTLNKNFKEAIKQNFKNLLLTIPGEKVMDVNFGAGLIRFLFEMDSTILRLNILSEIDKQVATYMPFLEVLDVQISEPAGSIFDAGEHSFFITVVYRIASLKIQDQLDISLKSN